MGNLEKLERDRARLQAKRAAREQRGRRGRSSRPDQAKGDDRAQGAVDVSMVVDDVRAATAARTGRSRVQRRRNGLLERLGWYEITTEPILTSTRQAEALNTALVATHPPLVGPLLGIDVDTGQPYTEDPFELYAAGRITTPNVLILGAVGTGKSSLIKTQFVTRQVAMGRQVAVFDRKRQQGRGEYTPIGHAAGATVIRFSRHGGHCINIIDPRIVATSQTAADADGEATVVGQDQLLLLVAERAHGRTLTAAQRHALRAAHRTALHTATAQGRVATIRDVIEALYEPQATAVPRPHLHERGWVDERRLFEAGYDIALDLERFVDGDLSGLIDGPTSDDLDLSAPLIIIDTSNLDEDSPALSLVMVVMTTFLSAVWAERPGQRLLVLEEGYHVLLTGVAGVFKSLAKRGRGIGLSVVTALHHISDVPETSEALALIREPGIVHIYAQHTEADQAAAARLFHLPATARDLLPVLTRGHSIVRVGSEPVRVVRHLLASTETALVNTDNAMLGRDAAPAAADVVEESAVVTALTDQSPHPADDLTVPLQAHDQVLVTMNGARA